MSNGAQLEHAYEQCLLIGREMVESGHHEVAYHAWMAALHCAEDAENGAWTGELMRLFRDHQRFLDAHHPHHNLATKNSHSGRGIFEVGACTAEAVVKRIDNTRRTAAIRLRAGLA